MDNRILGAATILVASLTSLGCAASTEGRNSDVVESASNEQVQGALRSFVVPEQAEFFRPRFRNGAKAAVSGCIASISDTVQRMRDADGSDEETGIGEQDIATRVWEWLGDASETSQLVSGRLASKGCFDEVHYGEGQVLENRILNVMICPMAFSRVDYSGNVSALLPKDVFSPEKLETGFRDDVSVRLADGRDFPMRTLIKPIYFTEVQGVTSPLGNSCRWKGSAGYSATEDERNAYQDDLVAEAQQAIQDAL